MQFSFSRFSYLCKLQFAANRKLYMLGIAAIAGMMLCYMFYTAFTSDSGMDVDKQADFLVIALLLASSFFGSLIFKQYGDKSKRIQSILLPVSNTERMGVAVLFSCILFPLVFALLHYSCMLLVNTAESQMLGISNSIYLPHGYEGRNTLILFSFVQPLVLLGAIWFRRFTFVKTVVMVCLFGILISFTNDVFNNTILKGAEAKAAAYSANRNKIVYPEGYIHFEMVNSAPYQSLRFNAKNDQGHFISNETYWVALPDNQALPFMALLGIIPLFFFYLTTVKLREQQL
jgi:hypothetical protein